MQVEKVVTLQMSIFFITKIRAEINVQSILDKTTEGLVEVRCEVLKSVPFFTPTTLLANGDGVEALVTALINRYLQL